MIQVSVNRSVDKKKDVYPPHSAVLSAINKNEMLTFATACMNFKNIMLMKMSHTKNKYFYDYTLMKYLE
jgi:hypothetical protein